MSAAGRQWREAANLRLFVRTARPARCGLAGVRPRTARRCGAARAAQSALRFDLLPETPFAGPSGRRLGLLSTVRARSSQTTVRRWRRRCVRAGKRSDVVIASQLHMAPCLCWMLYAVARGDRVGDSARPVQVNSTAWHVRYGLTWWKTHRCVTSLLRQFAGVTVVSEHERELLRPLAPHLRLAVVPNGVDTRACAGSYGDPEANTLIYPGALSYDANFSAMAHFLGAISPRLRARRASGCASLAEPRPGADRGAAHRRWRRVHWLPRRCAAGCCARVGRGWCALRKGGGTRLKVLEALALGTPVVSTSKGIEGLKSKTAAMSWSLIRRITCRRDRTVLGCTQYPDSLAAAGRRGGQRTLHWRMVGEQLTNLVRETARHKGQDYVYSSN